MKSNTLSQNVKTCGQCRYFGPETTYMGSGGKHECHANPPVVKEDECGIYSRYPVVEPGAIACRFFESKGGE